MLRFSVTVALSTLLLASISSAQQTSTTTVPNLIRYGGTLKDTESTAIPSATVGVTFSIYKQQDGGASVWMETQNVTPDASGQYDVILGSTTATGMPDDLFSQQEQRWLGVQVQGQAEQARVLLVSVPYAFKAHEAETLGGLPASAFVKAPPTDASVGTLSETGSVRNGNIVAQNAGVSTMKSPAARNKPVLTPCGSVTSITGGGPLGTLPLWSGVPCDLTNSIIVQSPASASGNIGIATATPSAKLEVNGDARISIAGDLNHVPQAYQIGPDNVLSIPGLRNLFVGALAGNHNENDNFGGADDTFLGRQAGQMNNDGSFNTFSGGFAGQMNIHGDANTFSGYAAGLNNLGSFNTFSGSFAGQTNVHGNENTFSGYAAGLNNLTDGNSFYGYQAGYSNDTAIGNAFFGHQAGYSNT